MKMYMVALIKERGKIVGFRMANDETGNPGDIPYDAVVNTIRTRGNNCIENLRLEGNEIKGYNGSIERYGVIGKSNPIVILGAIVDWNGNTVGYKITDTSGKIFNGKLEDVLRAAENRGVANGKVVEKNGKIIISAIEGTYDAIEVPKPSTVEANVRQRVEENKQEERKVPEGGSIEAVGRAYEIQARVSKELGIMIAKLKAHEKFTGSFVEKVIGTIDRLKFVSEKQEAVIKKTYKEWYGDENGLAGNSDKKDKPVNDSTEILRFKLMDNGTVYVAGLTSEARFSYNGDIVIPRTYKGKKVVGIAPNAFENTNITEVLIEDNIEDIGKYAFSKCRRLKYADLSAGKHQHLAAGTFYMCRSLDALYIGNQVKRIHESACFGCSTLEEVEIPKSVDTIARQAFMKCLLLERVKTHGGINTINDSAFRDCIVLKEFNFENVNSIGAYAFYSTGLESILLTSSVHRVGRSAFYNSKATEVVLEEGVEEIGESCFSIAVDIKKRLGARIKKMYLPKTLKSIGSDALSNVELAYLYYGTQAENYCIGFGVDYEYLDKMDDSNSTLGRRRKMLLGASIVEMMAKQMVDELKEPYDVELDTSKLLNIEMNWQMASALGLVLNDSGNKKEPNAIFKSAVNYITNTEEIYSKPLEAGTLRFLDILYVRCTEIYSDGCNRVYRFIFQMKDNLKFGNFILVIMHNTVVYICEDTNIMEMTISREYNELESLPIESLHAGDTLGNDSVIAGEKAVFKEDGALAYRVGSILLKRLEHNCPVIWTSGKNKYFIVAGKGKVIKAYDGRTYTATGRIKPGEKDNINILDVMTLEEFYKSIKEIRKPNNESRRFFNELANTDDGMVEAKKFSMSIIDEETVSDLYIIAKKFKEGLNGRERKDVDPSMLSPELFEAVANSYWMITKDMNWYNSIGSKSLNKVDEYTIGKYVVEEYVSNQVVKFSNPYMQGCKGAYVFVMKLNGRITGVYTSRLRLQKITENLYDMLDYDDSMVCPELFTVAERIDEVDRKLFFKFYDVLANENGWKLSTYNPGMYNDNNGSAYAISMYKPTGVMYLVEYPLRYVLVDPADNKGKKEGKKEPQLMSSCHPILKIGNIDRALEVAGTTNVGAKDSKLLKELAVVSYVLYEEGKFGLAVEASRIYNGYIKARQLSIEGESSVEAYRGLIDDRAIFMMGTKAKGEVKQFNGSLRNMNIVYVESDDEEEEYDDELEITLDIEDLEEDLEDTEDEVIESYNNIEIEEEDEDDEEVDFGMDEDNSNEDKIEQLENLTEEEIKQLGLTKEQYEHMLNLVRAGLL